MLATGIPDNITDYFHSRSETFVRQAVPATKKTTSLMEKLCSLRAQLCLFRKMQSERVGGMLWKKTWATTSGTFTKFHVFGGSCRSASVGFHFIQPNLQLRPRIVGWVEPGETQQERCGSRLPSLRLPYFSACAPAKRGRGGVNPTGSWQGGFSVSSCPFE